MLFIAAFFWQVTLQQRIISPADLMYNSYPWKASAPDGFSPENPYQTDDADILYPRRYALYNGTGDSWWQDDYITSDRNTFLVDALGMQFYPPAYVYEALPFEVANTAYHLIIILVAGLAMYLLLWQFKYPWLACVLGAVIYSFNGHFIVWLGHSHLPASLGVVPLMLFGFERFREVRNPAYLLIPAACIAIEIYLGYVPAWIVTGAVLVLYGATRLAPSVYARRFREAATDTAGYVAAGLVGMLLAAYSLIPSVSSAAGSSYQTGRAVGLGDLPLETAWTNLFPDYWGTENFWFGPFGNPPEALGYIGITIAPLTIAGLWHLRRNWLGWFSLALIVFAAGQVYGIPPLKELAHLPGIKQVTAGRWLFVINLAVALVAPAGLAALLDSRTSARERRQLAAVTAGVATVALMAVAVLYIDRGQGQSFRWITEGHGVVTAPWTMIGTPFHRQLAFIVLGAATVVVACLRPLLARQAAAFLLALTFLDLFAFGSGYNATVDKDDLYPTTPLIEFLQEQGGFFRIAPIASDGRDHVMPGNTPNVYGLNTIIGYDHYRNEAYLDYLDPMMSDDDTGRAIAFGYVRVAPNRGEVNRNLLSLLGVKYIVTTPSGLWTSVSEFLPAETPYTAYGDVTQTFQFGVPPETDAVEFFVSNGGWLPPGTEATIRVLEAPQGHEISSASFDAGSMPDGSWQRVELPFGYAGAPTIVIEAPTATKERPLIIWGAPQSPNPVNRLIVDGSPVDGTLTHRALRSPGDWAKEVYDGPDGMVYEVTAARPLAWGVGASEVVPTRDDALIRITDAGFDPAQSVVFAEDDVPTAEATTAEGTFEAEVTDNDGDSLAVSTNFSAGGWLLLSERYDDGWQVKIDGKGAKVLRGDNDLQVIAVPAGEHEVMMQFRPDEYVWGQRISIATVVVLVLGGALYATYQRQRAKVSAQTDGRRRS
ncbi:MAG: YfhO family protein [Dehalococcoidia bacterium]